MTNPKLAIKFKIDRLRSCIKNGLRGAGKVVDISGSSTASELKTILDCSDPENDWIAVGNDIRKATIKFSYDKPTRSGSARKGWSGSIADLGPTFTRKHA